MKSIEDQIKDKLQNAITDKGVDLDNLWEDISSELSVEEVVPQNNYRKWILFFILSLITSSSLVYFSTSSFIKTDENPIKSQLNQTDKKELNNESNTHFDLMTNHKTEKVVNDISLFNQKIKNDIISNEKAEKAIKDVSIVNQNSEENLYKGIDNSKIDQNRNNTIKKLNSIINEKNSITKDDEYLNKNISVSNENISDYEGFIVDNNIQFSINKSDNLSGEKLINEHLNSLIVVSENLEHEANQLKQMEFNSEKLPKIKDQIALSDQLTKIDYLPLLKQYLIYKSTLNFSLFPSNPIIRNVYNEPKWLIGTYVGVNYVFNQFSDFNKDYKRADLLNTTYSHSLGYSAALSINYSINDYLYTQLGIEYNYSYTQFSITQQWDSIIPLNYNTYDATITRVVDHYNKHQFLSIPMEIGWSKDYQNFGIKLGIGVGLNYSIYQSGKSIDENNVIFEYNDLIDSKAFFVNYLFSPELVIPINELSTINLKADIRFQPDFKNTILSANQQNVYTGFKIGYFKKI